MLYLLQKIKPLSSLDHKRQKRKISLNIYFRDYFISLFSDPSIFLCVLKINLISFHEGRFPKITSMISWFSFFEFWTLCPIFSLKHFIWEIRYKFNYLYALRLCLLWMPLCRIRSKLITFVFYCDRNRMRSKYLGGFKDLFRLQDPLSEKQDNSRVI